MDELITPRFQLVELVVPATQTGPGQLTFAQVPQLQSLYDTRFLVYILAIDVYTNEELTFSPFNANNPIATGLDLANTVLTLVKIGDEAHKFIPLIELRRFSSPVTMTPSLRDPFRFPDEWQIDWTKSYLQLVKTPPSAPVFSYMLGVHYSYYPTPDSIKAGISPMPWNMTGASRRGRY